MKHQLYFFVVLLLLISLSTCKRTDIGQNYIINKDKGRIILAYKAFEDFLHSDRSIDAYNKLLLEAYPEVSEVHRRQQEWGVIDSATFPETIRNYKREDFENVLHQYTDEKLHYLYDSIISHSHTILKPLTSKVVDLCFFLPYGSCFVNPEDHKNTIYISMWINKDDVDKIMAHEYAHVLHFDRRPQEDVSLGRELVSEGMAVYLTNMILHDIQTENSIPFMPPESFRWCNDNEQLIKDSIKLELNDSSERMLIRYIADGSFAKPPEGFVQKTGYYVGYRIIEECIKQGFSLEEICTLDSKTVIERSKIFNE